MEEQNRCLEAYKQSVEQRPFGMTVEQANKYLVTLQRVRDRCLAACEAGDKCNGQTKPLEGPEVFKRAGMKYRPEGYTCTLQGWVYHLTEAEAREIQGYENSRPEKWVTPKCEDYSTAIINGVVHHVWDRCSNNPYVIEYDTNKKKTLSKDWWKTPDGRQHAENEVVETEEHVKPFTPEPSPTPTPDPEEKSYDPCGWLCDKMHGGEKKWYDVGGKAQLAGCKLVCYAFIAGGILLAVAIALMGKKSTTKVIVTSAEASKEAAKAAARATK